MRRTVNNTLSQRLIILLALFVGVISPVSRGQILPPSLGKVEEKKRTPTTITRLPTGSASASKSTNTVLFVLTEPPDAEIVIEGQHAGSASNGEFRTELKAGRRYTITVSAGTDYESFTRSVVPKKRSAEVVRAALLSRYGLVRIGPILDGAKVFIDDQLVPSNNVQLDRESNTVRVDRLQPGEHTITYQHPDYVPLERRFKIRPSSEYMWTYKPEPATVELTVATDPDTVLYVDGEPKGTTTADGVLKRSDIRIGRHEIKLAKEDFEEFKTTFEFKYHVPVRIDQRLVPLPTSAEFSDDFDVPKPDQWTLPRSGLIFKDKRLYVENATTVGFPTNVRYRDFEMSFHLTLVNSGGAAWALRVKDQNNYYLFYLSGPGGMFPNRFNTYIVRNNEFDPKKPYHSDNMTTLLSALGQYEVHIKATGSTIEHEITPADTGNAENIGFFEDPNNTFRYGSIGFRTLATEKFSVDDLFVRPR